MGNATLATLNASPKLYNLEIALSAITKARTKYLVNKTIFAIQIKKSRKSITIYSTYVWKTLRALQVRPQSRDSNSKSLKLDLFHHSITSQKKNKNQENR